MFEFNSVTSFLAYALIISILLRLIYTFIVKNWNYFSERNIVFDRGLTVIGTFFGSSINVVLGKKSIPESIQGVYKKHLDRKFIGMYDIGGKPSYMINDPDLIHKIGIKDFDSFVNHFFQLDKKLDPLMGRILLSMSNQEWRDMRGTMSPLFTGSKMRQMLILMTECANDFNTCVRNEITSKSKTNGLEFDMMNLMMRLSNDIIGSTAFGIQLNSLKEPDNEFFKMGKELAYGIQGIRGMVFMAFPKLAQFFKLRLLADRQNQFFSGVINSALADRQKMNIKRNDMLNLLMLAKEGKLNDENDKESDQDTGFATVQEFIDSKKIEKLKNWIDEDLVAQCIIFFLAGFAGLSTTTCFLCHELGVNSEIQERLYQEIQETNEELDGKQVTFECLQKMKYLDMVVSETLRKWPIAFMGDRKCNKQYLMEDYDGTKALVQPGDFVWFPIFGIHRDPKYYPNPELFDPERFSDENKKNIQPGTYVPFGIGPRACIGNRFALLHIKAIVYNICLNFKIEYSEKTQVPLKIKGGGFQLDAQCGFFNRLKIRN